MSTTVRHTDTRWNQAANAPPGRPAAGRDDRVGRDLPDRYGARRGTPWKATMGYFLAAIFGVVIVGIERLVTGTSTFTRRHEARPPAS